MQVAQVAVCSQINTKQIQSGQSAGQNVQLYRSYLTCILDGHLHRVTYTRSRIDTIDSPDDEHGVARNM